MDKIVWTDPALEDLQAIHRYIERDSVGYASRLVHRLIDEIDGLPAFPRSARVIGAIDGEPVRRVLCGNYAIIYAHRPGACVILGITHGKRDPMGWLQERGERLAGDAGAE